MTAKKSTKKATGRKKVATKKKAAAKKSGARKKAGAGKKKVVTKRSATPRKSVAKKKPSAAPRRAAKAAAKPAPKTSGAKKATKKSGGKISSMQVNLGHVFALRPRVSTSFRQPDFLTARHLLLDGSYPTIQEATRAVVERALEITHEGSAKRGYKQRR